MLRIGLLLSLALCASGAHAEFYKWVDAEGNVQFSNQPPPKDTEAETLDIQVSAPMETTAPESTDTATDTATPAAANSPSDGEGITAEQLREKNCQVAQRNLDIFSGETAGIMVKGADDKLHAISAEQHQLKLAEARKQVETYCNPTSSAPAN